MKIKVAGKEDAARLIRRRIGIFGICVTGDGMGWWSWRCIGSMLDSMAISALCSVALLMRLDGSEVRWDDGSDYCRSM